MRARISPIALVLSFVLAGSGIAGAQSAGTQSGPLVAKPIDTRFVFSPDVKVTTVDRYTSTLLGFYAGTLFENHLLIGGAGYWLVDPHHEAGLYYFGFLTGYRVLGTDRVALDARVLAGGGGGEIYRPVAAPRPPGRYPYPPAYAWYGYHDDFLVAEPQAVLDLAVTDQLRLNFGVGYRATTADQGFNEAFRGVTGSVGVRFDLKFR